MLLAIGRNPATRLPAAGRFSRDASARCPLRNCPPSHGGLLYSKTVRRTFRSPPVLPSFLPLVLTAAAPASLAEGTATGLDGLSESLSSGARVGETHRIMYFVHTLYIALVM